MLKDKGAICYKWSLCFVDYNHLTAVTLIYCNSAQKNTGHNAHSKKSKSKGMIIIMSLPKFPSALGLSREEAINQVISSIAMEELGLSHILNAEGEKIQYVLGTLPGASSHEPCIQEVLAANESVKGVLEAAAESQKALSEKLKTALSSDGSISSQKAYGMIYNPTTYPVTVGHDENIPFTMAESMQDTLIIDNGIQVKTAGTYVVQYTINVIANQFGHFMVGINGVPQLPSFVFFSSVDNNYSTVVSGSVILHFDANDVATLINVSGDGIVVGAAATGTLGGVGNLSVFRIA